MGSKFCQEKHFFLKNKLACGLNFRAADAMNLKGHRDGILLFKPLTAKSFNLNFHPLKGVSR